MTVPPDTGPAPADLADLPGTARGRRSRARLVRAALEVFEGDGYQEARIADIARRAAMSYGSFYTYFDSKESIFREVVHGVIGEMLTVSRESDRSEEQEPVARIHAANRAYLSVYARNARIVSIIEEMSTRDDYFLALRLQVRELFLRRNEEGIRTLQAAGVADPDLDPHLAASALGGMVEHFAHVWFVLQQPFDETAALDTLTRLYARALGLSVPARSA